MHPIGFPLDVSSRKMTLEEHRRTYRAARGVAVLVSLVGLGLFFLVSWLLS